MDSNDPVDSINDETPDALTLYKQYAASMFADAETWLRDSELDRAISEAIPDALLIVDEAGLIVRVNHQFELMFGYPRGDVIGQPVEMLLPEQARARHVEQRRDFNDAPRIRDMSDRPILQGRKKNGELIALSIKLGPAVFQTGTFTIAVIRRKRA